MAARVLRNFHGEKLSAKKLAERSARLASISHLSWDEKVTFIVKLLRLQSKDFASL